MKSIAEVTKRVSTWNPARAARSGEFDYIDLSAIDNVRKKITGATRVATDEAPSRARQLVAAGDVLVSTVRPNLNAVAVVPPALDGATASTGFSVLRPADTVDGRYLFHWVRSSTFIRDMVRKATGASYPAVSDRIVKGSVLPLPALGGQRRIAAILDQADALHAMRRQQLAHLGSLPHSVFRDMFSESYEPRPLGQVATFIRGVTFKPDDKVEVGPGAVAVMRTKNVQQRLERLDEIYIPARLVKRQEQYLVQGDTLISSANSWNLVGKACFVDSLATPAAIGGFVTALRSRGELDPVYLFHWFTSAKIQETARSFSTQTTNIANLNLKRCADLPIPVPPVALQREFAERVAQIHAQQVVVQRGQVGSEELFSSLQSRAFRGDL